MSIDSYFTSDMVERDSETEQGTAEMSQDRQRVYLCRLDTNRPEDLFPWKNSTSSTNLQMKD